MPGLLLTPDTKFKTLKIKKLHPTFAAEIEGVDFSRPIPDDVFKEVLAASAKVTLNKKKSVPLLLKCLIVWRNCLPGNRS